MFTRILNQALHQAIFGILLQPPPTQNCRIIEFMAKFLEFFFKFKSLIFLAKIVDFFLKYLYSNFVLKRNASVS